MYIKDCHLNPGFLKATAGMNEKQCSFNKSHSVFLQIRTLILYKALTIKILIVEDEKELSKSMIAYLKAESYSCELAGDVKTAMAKIESFDFDCILLDISLPDGNGLAILEALKADKKNRWRNYYLREKFD